jgi:hypothetical protein
MFEFFSTISSAFSSAFASVSGAVASTSAPAIAAIAGWTGISAVAATAVFPVILVAGAVVAQKVIRNSWNAYKAFSGGPDLNLDINKVKTDSKNHDNILTNSGGEIAFKVESEKTFFFQEKGILSKKYELIGFKDKNGDLYQVTGEKKEGFFSNLWNSAKELASKFCNLIPFIPNTSHLPHYEIADISTNTFSDKLIIGDSNKSEGFTCNKISGADEFSQYKAKPSFWEKTKRALLEFSPSVNLNNESRLKTIVNNLCLHNENHAYANQNYENSKEKSEMSDGQNSQEEVISNKDQEVKQNGNSLTNPNGEKLQTNVKDKELGKKK